MKIVPSLLSLNPSETIAFYRDRLGFELTGCFPDEVKPDWFELTRDGAVLQFFRNPPKGISAVPILSGTIYFYPESVAELAREWTAQKVDFEWGPEVMPYGLYEFGFRDPNGYYLAFAEETADE